MTFRRLCVMVLVLGVAPSSARGQSLHVHGARLRVGAVDVGQLARSPVELVAFRRPREAQVRYRDETIAFEASVRLDDAHTYVSIGVGEAVPLRVRGGFSMAMRAGAWAPLAGRDRQGRFVVFLPQGMPARRGTVARDGAVARAEPPARGTFSHAPDRRDRSSHARDSASGPVDTAAPHSKWR